MKFAAIFAFGEERNCDAVEFAMLPVSERVAGEGGERPIGPCLFSLVMEWPEREAE